jgi:D-alanyl-D-alanine carboxypeptidase (penicillin-binding protein 5/6)
MKPFALMTLVVLVASGALAQEPYTAAIVLEPTTGKVLFEKNSNQPFPTASMIKMMTLLVVMDEIKSGQLSLDDPVTVSAKASQLGGSQVYLKQGEVFPVRELIAATHVHSANDAALALAEHVAGTESAFVELMRAKARELGLKNTDIHSPHGLPAAGEDQPDVMSPADLAKVGIQILEHPMLRELGTVQTMPFRDGTFTMYNPNRLLKIYPNATGIKTGYHGKAGFCVTASARKGNMDLIAVVMGSQRKEDNFNSAAQLFAEAFARHEMASAIKRGTVMTVPAKVKGGAAETVRVAAGDDANVLIERGKGGAIQLSMVTDPLEAPVSRLQRVGTIIVKQDGNEVAKVPALAVDDVPKQSLMKRLLPF